MEEFGKMIPTERQLYLKVHERKEKREKRKRERNSLLFSWLSCSLS
jgi:hypothetical protein